MFIKRGDGKILSVEQDEKAEQSRKKTAQEQPEKVKPSDNNQKSGS